MFICFLNWTKNRHYLAVPVAVPSYILQFVMSMYSMYISWFCKLLNTRLTKGVVATLLTVSPGFFTSFASFWWEKNESITLPGVRVSRQSQSVWWMQPFFSIFWHLKNICMLWCHESETYKIYLGCHLFFCISKKPNEILMFRNFI